jgi:hypothetical protein
MVPLTPTRKWRAITVATVLLAPACWAMLAGLVSGSADDAAAPGNAAALVAFGLALVPFVFVALAFLSEHPAAPGAVLRAMGLSLLVGVVVSALAQDAVTGIVAGIGAGGVVALRTEAGQSRRARVLAVALAAVYTLVLARTAGSIVLLAAPIFPFTGIGVADHVAEHLARR